MYLTQTDLIYSDVKNFSKQIQESITDLFNLSNQEQV